MPSSTHEAAAKLRRIIDRLHEWRHTADDVYELDMLVNWLIARLEAYETERDPQ